MFDCEIYRSSAQIAKHDWLQLENSFMVIKESINYMRVEVFVCQLWRVTGQLPGSEEAVVIEYSLISVNVRFLYLLGIAK